MYLELTVGDVLPLFVSSIRWPSLPIAVSSSIVTTRSSIIQALFNVRVPFFFALLSPFRFRTVEDARPYAVLPPPVGATLSEQARRSPAVAK